MTAPAPEAGELAGRHLLLGVTGGVAAFKACELARELQRRGATVQVAMTDAATKFIGPATFQALTGRPVFVDAWDGRIDDGMPHIDLSRGADAILVAPATADFMAKVAHGLADDLLSTLVLARDCPLLVAPAMNRQMWAAAATQRSVATLHADGVAILGPGSGEQACGETGDGRMLEAQQLVEETIAFFVPKRLAGRRVLVTAGPTFEPIDPVRGITNLSSGKMGYAIARACRHAGAEVVLVSGPTALDAPQGVRRVDVRSAREMLAAVQAELAGQDLFVAVAAVADWRVANASDRKLKKTEGGAPPALEFAQNPDILATVAKTPGAPYCVGFAAETEDLEANAQDKRRRKGVPLLVGNLGQATFGRDDNELLLVDAEGTTRLLRASKTALAARLVDEIARRLPDARC
ncbi:MAG: bifunctional phosphopantothenoylcysteine decarboxylase/phosphopantothenate--cysteine ligase CoaBC [Burkholderiaceae bacterium]|jgi:phosphopantothenoylcysteine decarboxylase/phosphopantothenate--cysteine ligase|nr:bifunctional phosphopantothenoylcysteine decarboxylase/phosphopantothenate--cysteine ligase CoaBC [Burkholderiales bacterium]MCZ8108623.1 bifunctional phosphopantothenoylcysteine decarboxylase/phosphopantothenate--cysteine ligase CoaBC [Burkholderiales bacterium]MCZ8336739.1 bifunctional phosphopantothenoylcysteine decarboxylase/phosphopantothenate--cysteine ligase CoaBC [Burkholderiaceae bacterium]